MFGRNSIYYHHLLLTIFEPLLLVETSRRPSPRQIVADAKKYLQTLIRLYYIRHGCESIDLFIVIPMMLCAYDCIDTINAGASGDELETLRSTLILSAQSLYYQRRNHYLADALYRVIRGRMRPQEARLMVGAANLPDDETEDKKQMKQAVRSHWPVSVVKNRNDVDSHVLTNLIDNLSVEDRDAASGSAG